jgi:hypothetical protein
MIVTLIIQIINVVVSFFDSLLPHFVMPSWLVSGSLIPSGAINVIAAGMYAISGVFPSAFLLTILVGVTSLWPVLMAYTVFRWIYCHVPAIAGFSLKGDC